MKMNKIEVFLTIIIVILILLFVGLVRAQESTDLLASGGQFTLSKSVVAGGGGDMQQTQKSAPNTAGQAVAGKQSSGGNFTLYSGFWTPENFSPTAATVIVGGRVRTANGNGIRNVRVTITYPSGASQVALTGAFGYYSFEDIPAGATYTISVRAKKYIFSTPIQICTILEERQDIDFIAEPLP